MVQNVMVFPNNVCVSKHELLATVMEFKSIKMRKRKCEPRITVWKVKNGKRSKACCMLRLGRMGKVASVPIIIRNL